MRYSNQLHILLVFIVSVIFVDSSTPKVNVQTKQQIQLQAPHLASHYQEVRPAVYASNRSSRPKIKPVTAIPPSTSNPCDGSTTKTNGTTCGLKEIMIGRCLEYQYVKRGLFLSNQSHVKNCTQLYQTFESAVRYKSYCDVNMTTYKNYFEQALAGVHVINRAMFWSGTYAVTHAYSGNGLNYITLEDTLAASMVNGLVWCGKANDTMGYDYNSCPYNCKDNKWADLAFWGLASKTFAQLAMGEIYVVLNGSQTNGKATFRNDSYFSEFELPNLRQNGSFRVTKVNTLILHSPDQPVIEKCGVKSLRVLEDLIRSKGFDYACTDDPEELILIMCGDQWEARECQIARRVLRHAWDVKLHGKSHSNQNSFTWIFVVFLCSLKLLVED